MIKSQTRRRLSDGFIRVGVALQVVFLLMVDWGSIVGMRHEPEIPWGHVAGMIIVNVVLLASAVVAWRWMLRAQRGNRPPTARSL